MWAVIPPSPDLLPDTKLARRGRAIQQTRREPAVQLPGALAQAVPDHWPARRAVDYARNDQTATDKILAVAIIVQDSILRSAQPKRECKGTDRQSDVSLVGADTRGGLDGRMCEACSKVRHNQCCCISCG